MFVCCECCVLSGRGLCDGLITRPEESYILVIKATHLNFAKHKCAITASGGPQNVSELLMNPYRSRIFVSLTKQTILNPSKSLKV